MSSYEEGQKLFELGMIYASKFKCSEAIKYYTLSIEANENSASYINRANLLGKRIRHFEALQDLLRAKNLDKDQNNEFSYEINREISLVKALTNNYATGLREKLINDLKEKGMEHVASRIICASFEISQSKWQYSALDDTFLEYHFFNELDNISKFDELDKYPEIVQYLESYPPEFIQHKLDSISSADLELYHQQVLRLHAFLCSYDEKDMQHLRTNILYLIDCKLMERDFGELWFSLNSECKGITREAEQFISVRS